MSGGTNGLQCGSWSDAHTARSGLPGESPFLPFCLRPLVPGPGRAPSCFHGAGGTIRLHLECLHFSSFPFCPAHRHVCWSVRLSRAGPGPSLSLLPSAQLSGCFTASAPFTSVASRILLTNKAA